MTFLRLRRADWLALVAALALLLVMSIDWYSTEAGVEARQDEKSIEPRGATAGEVPRALDRSAKEAANRAEKNAWQADAFADRLILFVLLATAALAIASAFLRAAGARPPGRWSPSALTAMVGLAAVLLLAARIIQKPEADIGAVVRLGAPLGLVCAGLIALAARVAWKAEDEETSPDAVAPESHAPAEPVRPAPLFDHGEPAGGAVATAVRPVALDQPSAPARTENDPDTDWAPDWSDPAAPAPEQPAAKPSRRRRGRRRRRS